MSSYLGVYNKLDWSIQRQNEARWKEQKSIVQTALFLSNGLGVKCVRECDLLNNRWCPKSGMDGTLKRVHGLIVPGHPKLTPHKRQRNNYFHYWKDKMSSSNQRNFTQYDQEVMNSLQGIAIAIIVFVSLCLLTGRTLTDSKNGHSIASSVAHGFSRFSGV
jgi:hypothetical protein